METAGGGKGSNAISETNKTNMAEQQLVNPQAATLSKDKIIGWSLSSLVPFQKVRPRMTCSFPPQSLSRGLREPGVTAEHLFCQSLHRDSPVGQTQD